MGSFYSNIFFFFCVPFYLLSVDIAITFDDYPMSKGALFSTQERTKKFIEACSSHRCKAVFFCIGENCRKMGEECLTYLDREGHFLANHSMTHTHLSSQSLHEWEAEIKKTEALLKPYKHRKKWFRYPFLDYGNRELLGGSLEKTRSSLKTLKKLGYVEGYVTINTFDWYIDYQLKKGLEAGKIVDFLALKDLYLNLLKEWCLYYLHFYQSNFSEKITHTLLLHANDLNALYLKEILQMLKESKWNIVSPKTAFKSANWRKKVYDQGLILPPPKTLDVIEIDRLFEEYKIFNVSN